MTDSTSRVKPYKIHVAQHNIDRLHKKLELADLPGEEAVGIDVPCARGTPISVVRRLLRFWKEEFDWREIEAGLNMLPQFITSIEVGEYGQLDIHLIHKRRSSAGAIPLLFLHGWPGNFLEVTKMLGDLVSGEDGDNPSFHVVAPSLLDFGFSSATKVNQHSLSLM